MQQISVFFSYGHDCEEIVLKIKEDLEKYGFNIWIDRSEIKVGNEWREKITSGILNSDIVMAFLSSHALRKNGVCLNELSIAVGCKYGHIKTILLEPDIEYLIPSTISNVQYCDMSKWRMLKASSEELYLEWYNERLQEILSVLSSKEAIEMNNHLKYLEQMLCPAMWHLRQSRELQKDSIRRAIVEEKITHWLGAPNPSRFFVIYGEPGTGKSNFLINYHHLNHEVGAIAFCDWKKQGRDKIKEIIRSIAFQLAAKIAAYRTSLIWYLENRTTAFQNLSEEELFDFLLVEPLQGSIQFDDEYYVVVIDAINELNDDSYNLFAEIISSQGDYLPKSIRFIISSRKDNVIMPYFSDCESYEILSNIDETISTIKNYYRVQLERFLADYNENEADRLLDILAENSEGNFLYAELFVRAICERKILLEDLSAMPQGLNGIYHQWFTHLFPNDEIYLNKYYLPLCALCAIDDPIPVDLLKKVMHWNAIELGRFVKTLKYFLRCQNNAFGKETVTLFHSSMKRWLLSEYSGCFRVDEEEGLELLRQQLENLFDRENISPYQCKLLIAVLEKVQDKTLRKKIYSSQYFFEQYYLLAKAYESVRSGYHKAILIYTHLKEICIGLPSVENQRFMQSTLPYALSRCYCQIGDYYSAKETLSQNIENIEKNSSKEDLMEVYYILGSVYDWFGEREISIQIFNKLNKLAIEENNSSYILRAIAGLIWNEHFNNIEEAIPKLENLISQGQLSVVDREMCELIRARILLSVGDLEEALSIYDNCLVSFEFSFNNDVRGYRKNRLLLIEILPACYDSAKFEKGVETGKQILGKIKNTGWLEECYCASWISLNFLGMGDVDNAKKYFEKSLFLANSVEQTGRSQWITMHLTSLSAYILFEEGKYIEALNNHKETLTLALRCNDAWVAGDACYEIAKIYILYETKYIELAEEYINQLTDIADSSHLIHLKQKSDLMQALWAVTRNNQNDILKCVKKLESYSPEKVLPSTNYIEVSCIKAILYKVLQDDEKMEDQMNRILEYIVRPEYKNRPSVRRIIEWLNNKKSEYQDFGVEYCDPLAPGNINYWMKLEHLGRYLWAGKVCATIDKATVADMACATGYGSNILAETAAHVVGFDRAQQYLALAEKRENVRYVCADFDTMDVAEYQNKFDVIVSFETIEHVKYPERLIQSFYRMLRKDGKLLLSFPNAMYEKTDETGKNKDIYHLHIFAKEQMLEWLEKNGFIIEEILGQSYCNDMCQVENEAIKNNEISVELLEHEHKKTGQELIQDGYQYALPTQIDVERSYSYILLCRKKDIQ